MRSPAMRDHDWATTIGFFLLSQTKRVILDRIKDLSSRLGFSLAFLIQP